MSAPKPSTVGLDPTFVQVVAEAINSKDFQGPNASRVAKSVNDALLEVLEVAHRFQRMGRRMLLSSEDVDCAVRLKGVTPPFGYETGTQPSFKYAGNLVRDMFVKDDREVDLQSFIQNPLPKLPLAPSIRAHWLVIDGEQPSVPENPTPEKHCILPALEMPSSAATEGPPLINNLSTSIRKTAQVQIKSSATHPVCLEQQIFFKEVMEAAMGVDDARRTEALSVIQSDCGIQTLLPRFSLAIAEGVRCNVAMKNLAFLIYHMRVLRSLANNKSVSLEGVLHEVLPAILTCIVSRTLCTVEKDNHWVLRNFSSKLLTTIYKIVKVLADVLRNPNNSMTSICAAAIALCDLGQEVTQAVVLPLASHLIGEAQNVIHKSENQTEDAAAASKLMNLLKALVPVEPYKDQDTMITADHASDKLGQSLHKRLVSRLDH